MMTIEPKFNNQDDEYYVDIPIDNQTLHMSFWLDDRCQPLSWAEVQSLQEIREMTKWELERRFKRASNE